MKQTGRSGRVREVYACLASTYLATWALARLAALRCTTPDLIALSIAEAYFAPAALAVTISFATTAASNFLRKVLMAVLVPRFRVVRRAALRAAFIADLVLAMVVGEF